MHSFFGYLNIWVARRLDMNSVCNFEDQSCGHAVVIAIMLSNGRYQAVRRVQSEMLHHVLGVLKDPSKEIMCGCTLLWLKLLYRTDIEGPMEYFPVRTPVILLELQLARIEDGYEPTFTY